MKRELARERYGKAAESDMKSFLQLFIMVLIIVVFFLFFGGFMLFDFYHNFFVAAAACAFIIALIIHGFVVQSEKIEALEKRIQALEQDKKDS